MINLIYPSYKLDCSIYNKNEYTFVKTDPHHQWTLEYLLSKLDLEYTTDFQITDNKKKYYVVFNMMLPKTWADLENIPIHIWKYLQTHNNVKLILYNGPEANGPERYITPWNNLKNFLEKKKIQPRKVYYISGNLNVKNCLRNFNYWKHINALGIDIFEMINLERLIKNDGLSFIHALQNYKTIHNKKNFLCLNNSLRDHRQALLFYLHKHNQIKNNIVSCNWSTGKHLLNREEFNERYNIDGSTYENFNEIMNAMNLSLENNNVNSNPSSWYSNTKFSVVTETHDRENLLFITEKTYKPLVLGHPFLVLGSPRTLEYLKDLGYKTFEKYFDESYDRQNTVKQRMKIILKNINNSIEIDEKLYKILEHNREVFFQQPTWSINHGKIKCFL